MTHKTPPAEDAGRKTPLLRRRCVLAGIGVGVLGSGTLLALAALGPRKTAPDGTLSPDAGLESGEGMATPDSQDVDVTAARGPVDAPVTVEMFGSFTCGHCARAHATTLPEIEARFVEPGTARLVHEPFPLDPLALAVSALATCAPAARRWGFVGELYARQSTWARAERPIVELRRIAAQAGIPAAEAEACMREPERSRAVMNRQDQIRAAVDVRATPTFRVYGPSGSEVLRGAVGAGRIAEAIEAVR